MAKGQDEQLYDAVVVGGGFYGAAVAIYLRENRGFNRVLIVESQNDLMLRASKNNQARVHNGLHYPRSLSTGYSSSKSYARFRADWPTAIFDNFDHIYCVASTGSKVSSKQFEAFASQIGSQLTNIEIRNNKLFNPRLISKAYHVSEVAFNVDELRVWAKTKIERVGIEMHFESRATNVELTTEGLCVEINRGSDHRRLRAKYVFNCTYSETSSWAPDLISDGSVLKHEFTEMALVEVPTSLEGLGFTVMDGPFFSVMPYPSRSLSTFSHVRYTPHNTWTSVDDSPPNQFIGNENETRFGLMRRDAQRYIPELEKLKYVDSIYEIKTVLQKSELNDSRPILFDQHQGKPGLYSILGGKIDNIYDVFDRLDKETFAIHGN